MHWLKLWTRGWLEGSIRFDLTPAQRSVFIDLCALARESRNPPWVQANETTAYPHSWLANKLNIPLDLLETTLQSCKVQQRISENDTGIKVLKFEHYQAGKLGNLEEKGRQIPNELAAISTLFEENIGRLTPTIAERLKDIVKEYPAGWFEEALKDAVGLEHRNLKYIEAILERWKKEGFKSQRKGGKAGEQRPRQKRAKAITYIRGSEEDPGKD